jgi:hypothetical protein
VIQPPASINIGQPFWNLLDAMPNSVPKILVFLIVLDIGRTVEKVLPRIASAIATRRERTLTAAKRETAIQVTAYQQGR